MSTLRAACQLHVRQGRPQAALQLLFTTLPVVSAGAAGGMPQLILTVLACVLSSEVSRAARLARFVCRLISRHTL